MNGFITRVGVQEYAAGSVIAGKYRLLHRLGQGGMGSIWAAHNPTLDISVALKLIRLDTASDDAHARLIQEARATARLADPGIVRIYDVGHTEQGDPFITMELLTGTNLRQTLDGGPLEPVRAVRTLLPIVRALECAHRGGIVHRDVKPDNIVLAVGTRGDVQPKLVDFGVAKILTRPNQLTSVGAAVGSPLYMSPEQARGEPVDARTDLWSICVVLYEAIMGAPPFDATNSNALLHAIATQEAPALVGRQVCDEGLSRIIDRGLSKRREARWQHARDLMLALADWLREQGATDDITGLSLRGRAAGLHGHLPHASGGALAALGAGRKARPARVAPTLVNLLGAASASDLPAAESGGPESLEAVRRAALAATASSLSPDRRMSVLLWAALGFIGLGLLVLALSVVRRESRFAGDVPLGPPGALREEEPLEEPPAPSASTATGASPAAGASTATNASATAGAAAATSTTPETPSAKPGASSTSTSAPRVASDGARRDAPRRRSGKADKMQSAKKPSKAESRPEPAPKPARPTAPFKNPFE